MIVKKVVTFAVAFFVWCLLAYPGAGERIGTASVVAGLVASALVAALYTEALSFHVSRVLNPVRWFWFLVFAPVFAWYTLVASVQVMYLVLHPDLPIRPGVVKVRTRLRGHAARAVLAICITLTPGTLILDVTEDGYLYVHWLVVKTSEMRAATRAIVGRFEWLIEKILE